MRAVSEVSTAPVGRRTLLKGIGLGGAAVAATGLSSCTTPPSEPAPAASPSAAPAGGGQIDAAGVERGLAALPAIIEKYMRKTGIPGLAVAVVYEGEVRYLEGFGTRQEGKPEKVDQDTVFQLASVSKPISSTVIAAALTKKLSTLGWDDPIRTTLPDFTLSDRWVGEHVTPADMFAHRSGLPDHAGNLLEDLDYNRAQILERLRVYPLHRFRDHYDYTNYGLTAGAEAVAKSTGRSWETLAQQVVFEPLGMTSSSFTFADLQKRTNRAAMHQKVRGAWVPNLRADYDGQAPAGSASSSIRDMARWVTMLLAEGKPIMDADQLKRIWRPSCVKPAVPEIGKPASFYGLGWNVNYEPTGELRVSHSGGFERGAATSVTIYPSKGLAIVGLSNAEPLAVPEAIAVEFADVVRYGKSTQEDWQAVIEPFIAPAETADNKLYVKPAPNPKPARPLANYVGRYRNALYGTLTVALRGKELSFTVGPGGHRFVLRHYSGDDFFFQTIGEDASGFSGAIFRGSRRGIGSLTVNAWNADELGTFVRA